MIQIFQVFSNEEFHKRIRSLEHRVTEMHASPRPYSVQATGAENLVPSPHKAPVDKEIRFVVGEKCYRQLHVSVNACTQNLPSREGKHVSFRCQTLKFSHPNV